MCMCVSVYMCLGGGGCGDNGGLVLGLKCN